MRANISDPREPTPAASPRTPAASPRTPPSGAAAGTTAATAPRSGSRPAAAGGEQGGGRRVHPLWLALGAAALFGLIFGLGAVLTPAEAPSGTTVEEDTINVIQAVDPSVVQVQARGTSAGGGVGSGEILTTSGYIVTNDHVVHGFSRFTALLADGRRAAASLIGEAPHEDLAVLKISASDLKPITVGDSSQVQVGEFTLALGSPLGLEQSATSGIVSALDRQASELVNGIPVPITGLIQTSAPINPGNSGGALVNLKGQLIGIPTLAAVDPATGVAANGIGFAITSNRMQVVVKQLTGGAA